MYRAVSSAGGIAARNLILELIPTMFQISESLPFPLPSPLPAEELGLIQELLAIATAHVYRPVTK